MVGSFCNNSTQFGALRRIASLSQDQSAICYSAQFGALRPIAELSLVQSAKIQNNSARCDGFLHFRRINLSQFRAIRRAETDCLVVVGLVVVVVVGLVVVVVVELEVGVVVELAAVLVVGLVVGLVVVVVLVVGLVVGLVVVIEVGMRDQSVTIQRNSAHCDGLVHICGINL